jgi:hypothetical protein
MQMNLKVWSLNRSCNDSFNISIKCVIKRIDSVGSLYFYFYSDLYFYRFVPSAKLLTIRIIGVSAHICQRIAHKLVDLLRHALAIFCFLIRSQPRI